MSKKNVKQVEVDSKVDVNKQEKDDVLSALAAAIQNINVKLESNTQLMQNFSSKVALDIDYIHDSINKLQNVEKERSECKDNVKSEILQSPGKQDLSYISAWKDLGVIQ